MRLYTTTLPSLPKWQVKVKTMWYKGNYVASTTLVTSNGTVTINKEHENEHMALHLAIDTIEELVNRIQYPHLGRLR
jgi:ribosome-associated translation inhibitor RaiA